MVQPSSPAPRGGHARPVAAAVLVTAVLASGCGAGSASAGPPSGGEADGAGPDRVCRVFGRAYLSVDTRSDAGPADARRRAARAHGTPALRSALAAGASRPDPRFREWARHRGRVEITTARPVHDDPPPTANGQAAAGFVFSGHVAGDGDWRRPYGPVTVYCSLRARPAGWRVHDVTISTGRR